MNSVLSTVSDRKQILEYISFVRENLYKTNVKKTVKKIEKEIPEKYDVIFDKILKDSPTVSAADSTLADLEKSLLKIPIVSLTLSYYPTKSQLSELSGLFRDKTSTPAIIEYQVNRKLGIGVIIDFQGKRLTNL